MAIVLPAHGGDKNDGNGSEIYGSTTEISVHIKGNGGAKSDSSAKQNRGSLNNNGTADKTGNGGQKQNVKVVTIGSAANGPPVCGGASAALSIRSPPRKGMMRPNKGGASFPCVCQMGGTTTSMPMDCPHTGTGSTQQGGNGAEIGTECIEPNPQRRPRPNTRPIQGTQGFIGTGLCTPSETHVSLLMVMGVWDNHTS